MLEPVVKNWHAAVELRKVMLGVKATGAERRDSGSPSISAMPELGAAAI